ncbi:MAG TPA: polymer-forming cytoskeletal protein [Firmicutes bacterium]|jgi:cytoskeletal protein CcmA (bactofilin family)|nr:polymer-forming cytoskeletal protein [Bacillota bacterium]
MVYSKKRGNEALIESSNSTEGVAGKLDTVIGQGAVINGSINIEGTLRVDGKVEGEISVTGDLLVGETGVANAIITAQNVTVAGTVKGNITANGKLDLLASGKVYGDINVSDLVVSQGAILQGGVSVSMTTTGENPKIKTKSPAPSE